MTVVPRERHPRDPSHLYVYFQSSPGSAVDGFSIAHCGKAGIFPSDFRTTDGGTFAYPCHFV